MGSLLSRRTVLAFAACGAAAAVWRASPSRSTPRSHPIRYEDGLASLFASGHADLTLIALAHLGGLSDRMPKWLVVARERNRDLHVDGLMRLGAAVLTADVDGLERALRETENRTFGVLTAMDLEGIDRADPRWLDTALSSVVNPLVLLSRGDVLSALHRNSLQRLGDSSITPEAILALARAQDWTHAVEILDQARDRGVGPGLHMVDEALLWKYAYLHRQIESVLPRLAQISSGRDTPFYAERRPWVLKANQIRAGMAVELPVIEADKQPNGYYEAAAMQIAALADDPAAADLVMRLRGVLRPGGMEIIHADRKLALRFDPVELARLRALAQIAARRKDYAKAAVLARMPRPGVLIDPPSQVIDAFFEEGDWRGAAEIAKDHDPREQPVVPGFDDTRIAEYVGLYTHLAVAAAWGGDDRAAAEFLAKAKTIDAMDLSWIETLLAGAAEDRLPRKLLHVLADAFRTAD